MKKIAFIYFTIMSLLSYLIGSMFISDLSDLVWVRMFFWLIHIILISTVVLAPFLSRIKTLKEENVLYRFYQWSAYHLMGFYFLLLFFMLIKAPIAYLIKFQSSSSFWSWFSIGASILLTILGYWVATKEPSIVKVKIKIEDKYKDLKNLKIVQISDVHVSQTIRKDFVEKIVAISNSLRPDLVMLTGDFVDGHVEQLKEEVEPFKKLESKYGQFYVPGNHEYYWGLEEWLMTFKKLNFNVLLNSSKEINVGNDSLVVGGVHDLASHRMNKNYKCEPDLAFINQNPDAFRVLLAHQPKTINLIKKEKVDLVLSGHTHAGQFFPASLLIFLFQPYVKGLHKVKNTWLYINQGTGYWGPPNRLGTKSEITLIELV